jgi:hypothetical protein
MPSTYARSTHSENLFVHLMSQKCWQSNTKVMSPLGLVGVMNACAGALEGGLRRPVGKRRQAFVTV